MQVTRTKIQQQKTATTKTTTQPPQTPKKQPKKEINKQTQVTQKYKCTPPYYYRYYKCVYNMLEIDVSFIS